MCIGLNETNTDILQDRCHVLRCDGRFRVRVPGGSPAHARGHSTIVLTLYGGGLLDAAVDGLDFFGATLDRPQVGGRCPVGIAATLLPIL